MFALAFCEAALPFHYQPTQVWPRVIGRAALWWRAQRLLVQQAPPCLAVLPQPQPRERAPVALLEEQSPSARRRVD